MEATRNSEKQIHRLQKFMLDVKKHSFLGSGGFLIFFLYNLHLGYFQNCVWNDTKQVIKKHIWRAGKLLVIPFQNKLLSWGI